MTSVGGGTPAGKDCWHILSGEYPPQPGGVSDYTAGLAEGLAKAGAEVHVWVPPASGDCAGRRGGRRAS